MPANNKVNTQLEVAIRTLLFDQPVAYHPALARAAGSVNAGILLSQFLYWTPRSQDAEGWFWKTRDDITQETALSRTEQEGARKVLIKAGVLEEKLRGVPARMHFRLNIDRLTELLAVIQSAENPPTSRPETPQPVGGKPANWKAENPPTISKTTSEITPEITVRDRNFNSKPDVNLSINRLGVHAQENSGNEAETNPNAATKRPKPAMQRLGEYLDELAPGKRLANPNHPIPQGEAGEPDPQPASEHSVLPAQEASTGSLAATVGNQSTDPAQGPVTAISAHQMSASPPAPTSKPATAPKRSARAGSPMSQERLAIASYLTEFAAELGDQARTNATISRALHIYERSGLTDLGHFTGLLIHARRVTQEHTDSIRRHAVAEGRPPTERLNKVKYYFSVLEGLCGLREDLEQSSPPSPKAPRESHPPSDATPLRKSLLHPKYAAANQRIRASSAGVEP